ncbi:MAG: ATP-binding protein [Alphaproteobacteria bacterium]
MMRADDRLPPLPPDAEQRVQCELAAYLFRLPYRVFGSVLTAALVVGAMWGEVAAAILVPWLGLVCASALARYGLAFAYKRANPTPDEVGRWTRLSMIGSCITAALWGASSGIVWLTPSIALPAMVGFAIAGISAAGMVMSHSHRPSAYGFLLLSVGPLAVNLLAQANGIFIAMGVMSLLFLGLLFAQARVMNASLVNSLRLKEANSALVTDLSLARDTLEARVRERTEELAATNQSLVAEMEARKEAEIRLRQFQKMEAIGQLTGGIAHDFNNLLGVVLGNLDLAARAAAGDARQLSLLKRAIDAAERGASLTHRLLAFSRRQTLDPAVVDINGLVGSLIELMKRTIGEAIDIVTEPGPGLWSCVIDRSQLENAVLNLAINARDAMPSGGRLTIRTRNVTLDEREAARQIGARAGDYVLVEVADTGVGMSKALLDRAFEPFFTTKEPGKGTGLGLSMVYGFVNQSGGHLQIDSEVGRGTAVRLFLPRAGEARAAAAMEGERRRGGDRRQVPRRSTDAIPGL